MNPPLTTSQRSKEAGDIFEHVCRYQVDVCHPLSKWNWKIWR